ncbi:VOC family protein [Arthrobacter pascens]|uniref:VOC family protein n=1 Tax=Arthrobacter pascens TaxID=1677 RepID=UPI00196AAF5D|nr:VOC family protein [Arthrobacter pascens]MBN3496822.1 VOC family protein [Arthrobacter pascens]
MEQQRQGTARTYPEGVPCWVDTQQPDVEAAMAFYGGLFGWEFEDAAPPGAAGRYVIATLDGQEAGAIAGPGIGFPAWHTYISVENADTAVRHLLSVGATLKSAPADGSGGVQAVLADPQGAEFRIWQAGARPGAQAVNLPGGWNFSDLHTTDVETAVAFYGKAFQWEFDDRGFGTMIRRPGYGDHLEATVDPNIRVRQSGDAVPRGFEDAVAWFAPAGAGERPRWHVTFTVADRDRAALDAERLGGRVLGQEDTEWTRTVLIRDPGGAVFTASQYTPPSG